jgi:site-specific DNA-methyltransferase (adenine-specific)
MNYKLIKGDCLDAMASLDDGSIDLVLTDPPYGTTACKWDSVIPLEPMWEQLKRVTKKNGAIVLFGAQPFTSALVMSNPKMFKYEWVWDKVSPTGHLNAKKRPMKKLENVLVFAQSTPVYYPQGLVWNPRKKSRKTTTQGSNCYGKHGGDNIATWQGYPTERIEIKNENGLHPTQKPVALVEYLIKTYTNEGETVLDFTMGSGTTGVACGNLNREFIGIELDKTYYVIAEKRIKEAYETP